MTIKNLLYFSFLFTNLSFFFFSCKEEGEEDMIFKGPYHIRFTDSLTTVKESIGAPIKISIHNAGPQLDEEIKVTYSISGSAREDKDFSIQGTRGEVIIPAGESFGYIDLKILNNANNILESQNITFTIVSVSSSTLQIGRSKNGIMGKSTTLIIEDDCILSGKYKSYPPDSLSNVLSSIDNITLTSIDCREYHLSNWDIYLTTYFPESKSLRFIDNGDNTITIPEQEAEKLNSAFATIQGSGFLDPETKRITLDIEFLDIEDKPIHQVTLYPQ